MRNENDEIFRTDMLPMYEDHRKVLVTPFCPQALSQGRLERIIQDALLDVSGGTVVVERGKEASGLEYDASVEEDQEAYPITVRLRKTKPGESANSRYNDTMNIVTNDTTNGNPDGIADAMANGTSNGVANGSWNGSADGHEGGDQEEVVRARYLIGCDGARSWLRKQLGFKTEGSHTNTVW